MSITATDTVVGMAVYTASRPSPRSCAPRRRTCAVELPTATVVVTSDAPPYVADVEKAVDEAGYERAATHV
jgi:hypothetical protein